MSASKRAEEQTLIARPWLISGLTLAVDQVTKYFTTLAFAPGESLPLLPPIVYLTYVQNTGAAFGLLRGYQGLFIVCSLLVIGWIIWELARHHPSLDTSSRVGFALVLGGAAGNLIDRLRLGWVIDFIDLRVWPVFNVGDTAITVGVALLLLGRFGLFRRFLRESRRDRLHRGDRRPN